MKLKEKLESLKSDNELNNFVIDYYLEDENIKQTMDDLSRYGCKSGMINSLIYYKDTEEFYKKYQSEINSLLEELIEVTGINNIYELLPALDKEDPLMLESHNQNELAWFGFEEISNKLYTELFENEIEYEEEKEEKIKALYKKVGKKPKIIEVENTLEAKQELVGGLIEVVPFKNALIICNEEGKLLNMKPNVAFEYDYIAGDLLVVGDDIETGDFISLTDEQIRNIKKSLNEVAIEYENEDEMECE